MKFLRFLILPLVAALLLSATQHVLCGCQRSAEGTFGPLQKACQVPLCLSYARGRDLEKTRALSEVQNETS